MKLSLLTILLGVALCIAPFFALTRPKAFAAAARKFPRNYPLGVVLMLLATAWFVWNVHVEPVADFAAFKPHMLVAFAAIGIGACYFVRDFLAVRGLAVLLLLLARLMLDTGRPHLGESPFVLVNQAWAYVLVLVGMWFTVTPWHLRDLLNWATATEARLKTGSLIRLAFGLFILALGCTAFRGM